MLDRLLKFLGLARRSELEALYREARESAEMWNDLYAYKCDLQKRLSAAYRTITEQHDENQALRAKVNSLKGWNTRYRRSLKGHAYHLKMRYGDLIREGEALYRYQSKKR